MPCQRSFLYKNSVQEHCEMGCGKGVWELVGGKTRGENLTFQIRIFKVWATLWVGQGFVWATSFLRAVKICATNVNLEKSIFGVYNILHIL